MREQGTAGGEAFQFGAARDSQTAADTAQLSGHVSTGAATFSFIQAIERVGTEISYGRLLDVSVWAACCLLAVEIGHCTWQGTY